MFNVTSPDALLQLSTTELMQLFLTLDAPDIQEMHGEYSARLLAQPGLIATLTGRLMVNSPFQSWRCKAFRPVDSHSGLGYNTFRQGNKIVQRYPMHTLIAPSRFDARPAFQLIYRHFHSLCGAIHMADEIRCVAPGLYLGIGTYGFTNAQRWIPYPFLLEGPQGAYQGDIGRLRKGFKIGHREIPGLTSIMRSSQ